MSFFNLGKRDADGRQARIEHRGRYLRASRTGGVALRAQTKAAGVNFTGNTAQGIRVSATPVKDTQVALQNGRFILRGRYGRGPTKLNLSKTGLTASTRNKLGTFNWIKPNRSSAKIAGVQVRGRNAVILQSIYFGFAAIGMLLRAAVTGLRILMQLLAWLAGVIQWAIRQTPPALKSVKRTIRNKWLRRRQKRLDPSLFRALGEASNDELKSMVWLIFTQWGLGKSVNQDASKNDGDDPQESQRSSTLLRAVERDSTDGDWHLAFLAGIAHEISTRLDSQNRAEILLDIDETLLASESRTVLQERMLEVYADFAGLRLQVDAPSDTIAEGPVRPERSTTAVGATPIDLNTASVEELQDLPHIGPERAEDLVRLRPIQGLEDLRQIDGVGPARLREIDEYGVAT
ncbi:DNA-binding protein [Guyparkeria sp. SCN-R1]|uniref:ComEA family DNA-binding protein n=1 Tax=Guyparkeria sp. SCN-R1 TaxID=2341113 RepID=UPI000F652C83|nr:helix-hairpin-helix domain-containing protein [Guyparkeria sp. SCN-R1]RRQ20216.1 DNA-binding protein [Guyparkeria sp. SCN-R1]